MDYQKYQKQLQELIKFHSISTDTKYKAEIDKTVRWLVDYMEDYFKVDLWHGSKCNPIIYAYHQVSYKAETILVYGHYDVQPADIRNGWYEDPFKLHEKDGKLYARGVVDNKGQFFIHLFSVIELIKRKKLKYNVIFLLEGNEETSNEDITNLIKDNKERLNADNIIVSDGELSGNNPVLEYSLRGGFNCKLIYKTADNNLHSGLYGGAVPNSANELCEFLGKLYDEHNTVTIPDFYEGVDEITQDQIDNNVKFTKEPNDLISMTGIKELKMEKNIEDPFTQTGLRPTLQITGLKSGYVGEGYSNIIPNISEVRINFRTVMSQDTFKIRKAFSDFVRKNTPDYVDYELIFTQPHNPIKINVNSEMAVKTIKILEDTFGREVLIKPVGGGIPVVSDFKEILGIDTLLVSLGNDDCNMHGVNENFSIDLIKNGLAFSEKFFGG